MRTQAVARFVRVPPRKAQLVLRQVQGKPVGEALALLQYIPRAAARLVEKTLRSAIANAEHNHQVRNLDDLWILKATADGGPMMKRVQPRAMGRAFFIRHRTSHLTVVLTDEHPRQATDTRSGASPSGPRAGAHAGKRGSAGRPGTHGRAVGARAAARG